MAAATTGPSLPLVSSGYPPTYPCFSPLRSRPSGYNKTQSDVSGRNPVSQQSSPSPPSPKQNVTNPPLRREEDRCLISGRNDGVERVRLRSSARSRRSRRAARPGTCDVVVVVEHLGRAFVQFRSSIAEQQRVGRTWFVFYRESRR